MKPFVILGVCGVLLIGGIAVWMLSSSEEVSDKEGDEVTACTLEALLCPDGSAVGRGGPSCTFDACPQTSPLVGELEQIGGDFQLILDAPVGGRGYVVPLQVQVSNVLGTLVGKRVQAFGRFAVGNTFVVETLEEEVLASEAPKEEEEVEPFATALAYQETVVHNDLSITFSELVEDNRCPSDVTCITAGRAVVELSLVQGGMEETFTVQSDEDTVIEFNGRTVEMVSVSPEPVSTQPLEAEDYTLEIEVR